MVQGVHWANPAYFSLVEKQADTKIVYKIHCYNPFDYSHAETAFAETYPGTFWSDATQEMETFNKSFFETYVFSGAKDFQNNHGVPFLIGEFGVALPQNGGEKYLSDLMTIAENYGWHYSLWNWNNTPEFNYVHLDQTYSTHYMDSILVHFNKSTTDVKAADSPVENFRLLQNYPNPFNPSTSITYSTNVSGNVKLLVFSTVGEELALLVSEHQNRGEYKVSFDGSALPSGIYFYRIITDGFIQTKKMVLLR
jgi:hypothetical protein